MSTGVFMNGGVIAGEDMAHENLHHTGIESSKRNQR
jgi:hypothetical protein